MNIEDEIRDLADKMELLRVLRITYDFRFPSPVIEYWFLDFKGERVCASIVPSD